MFYGVTTIVHVFIELGIRIIEKKIYPTLVSSSGVGVGGVAAVGIFLGCLFFTITRRRERLAKESKSKELMLPTPPSSKGIPAIPFSSSNFSQSTPPSYPSSKLDLEKGSTYFGAHIFTYEELQEATDNFDPNRQLGDGGFGTVYYGNIIYNLPFWKNFLILYKVLRVLK